MRTEGKPRPHIKVQGLLASATAGVLVFTVLLYLLPHLVTMLFFTIYALLPSAREHLEAFGGYTGYMRGNLLPRLYESIFSSYTWQFSWLWAILGAAVYIIQRTVPSTSRARSLWFRGIVVGLTLWYMLTYRVWNDPFWGILSTLLLIGGIILMWRYVPSLTKRLEEGLT